MESVATPPLESLLPWRVRIDLRALWIWVLAGALVLYLGLNGGGYDLVIRSNAAVVVWWIVLIGAAWGVLPAGRLSRTSRLALALFAGFMAWTAIAVTWSASSERSLEEVSRLACYLGVLVLAVTSYGGRRAALRHAVCAVACAVGAVAFLALLSRLRPGLIAGSDATSAFLPGAHARLSWPLDYWNGLAALVSLGLPLLLAIATSARSLLAQAAAAGAVPMLALCGYLTFSRGGAIASAAGVLAFLALAPDRIPKLATSLVCGAGGAILVEGAVHRHALEQGFTGSLSGHQGATLIVAVILVCAGVAIAQVGIGLAARHGTLPSFLQVSPRRARLLLVGVVVAGVIAALALGAPARLGHAWHAFKQPSSAALHQEAIARFGSLSGNGRYTYWKTAIDAMPGHWLKGWGPGTFQIVWLARAPFNSYVRNAHSLYIETLTEVGIIGLLLLIAFLTLVLGVGIRRVAVGGWQARPWAAAVIAACLAFMVSAAFDWVWQMPVLPIAVLLLAAALLISGDRREGIAESTEEAPRRPAEEAPRRPSRAAGLAARSVLILVALASLAAVGIPLAVTNAVRQSQADYSAGANSAALAAARSAVAVEPRAVSAQLQEALVLEGTGRLAAATRAARTATADEPQNWQAWLVLSRIEAESGAAGPALAAYRQARALNPRSPIFLH
ncbi:MAG: O-antigen ligase family protein [Actinomycetota bacterium]|nr:O-antigen ligase family protein [Actinomycetota bacterium]